MIKKNNILILIVIIATILSGCYNKEVKTELINSETQISSDNIQNYLVKNDNKTLTGSTFSGGIISGFFYPIVISGNYINYSGSMSFTIPNIFKYRDYYRNPQIVSTRDGLIFSSDDDRVLIIETTLATTGNITETNCTQINYGGRISKQEKNITINEQKIKITKQIFMISGEGVKKEKSKQTNICFVRNNIIYDIRRSNIDINEDTILNSISFY